MNKTPVIASDEVLNELITSFESGNNERCVVDICERLIFLAYQKNASDIHIEPFENVSKIRMRIDGMLIRFCEISGDLHTKLTSSIKFRASLDITEKRLPQDGHFIIPIDSKNINVRVSSMAVIYGEKIVMRLLYDNTRIDNPMYFGMSRVNYDRFLSLLDRSGSIIYLSGPTGSGKSTTLYMVLEALSSKELNICAIEDPVEKSVFGINQIQVNNTAGLTFESGLRAVLRQDPDVIMVGETRDIQTAEISARAAVTGHLVLSTLHTKSASESFLRLKDMGVAPYMVSASVAGCVSQRLLRKVCPHCKKAVPVTSEDELLSSLEINETWIGEGCERCHYTGYSGRIAVHEVLIKDEKISQMIYEDASAYEIERYAVETGMITMRESASKLLKGGIISEGEYLKTSYGSFGMIGKVK